MTENILSKTTFLELVPKQTTLLALDLGDKTIGVAISDTLWWTATPLKTIFRKSFQYDMEQLSSLIKGREIGGIIAGLPLQLDGTFGDRAKINFEIGEKIAQYLQKPIFYQDERLSSKNVEQVMISDYNMSRKKRKEKLDAGAAAFILERFIQSL